MGTAAALAAMTGCAPHPRLDVPPAILSDDWSEPSAPAQAGAPEVGLDLGSPELSALIAEAMRASPTLLASRARIEQAQALLKRARGETLPLVSASGEVVLARTRPGGPLDFSDSFASLDVALTLDLGGGLKAGKRSAAARARAAAFDRDAATLSVATEIARSFVTRSALGARLALLERSIGEATELDRIIRIRQREGVATMVDVGLQSIRLKQLLAERERLDQALDQTRTALALLVGEEAPRFASVPADLSGLSGASAAVPKPRDLVLLRSDVLAAEARLAAAGGDVQQARAAFLPQVTLSLGRASQVPLGAPLLSSVVLGADILAPIFSRHRLTANLELASAQQREAVQNYRQAILTAFTEVEDARSALIHADARGVLLDGIVEAASRTARLAHLQYIEGDADLRQLLDAQDLLISAQDARAVGTQERLEATLALYKATHGGHAG